MLIRVYEGKLLQLSPDKEEVRKAAIACAIIDADNNSIALQVGKGNWDDISNWMMVVCYLKTL